LIQINQVVGYLFGVEVWSILLCRVAGDTMSSHIADDSL